MARRIAELITAIIHYCSVGLLKYHWLLTVHANTCYYFDIVIVMCRLVNTCSDKLKFLPIHNEIYDLIEFIFHYHVSDINNFKYHVSCTDGKISVRINLLFCLFFFTVVPSNTCRLFVVNTIFSTSLVGVEVKLKLPHS